MKILAYDETDINNNMSAMEFLQYLEERPFYQDNRVSIDYDYLDKMVIKMTDSNLEPTFYIICTEKECELIVSYLSSK